MGTLKSPSRRGLAWIFLLAGPRKRLASSRPPPSPEDARRHAFRRRLLDMVESTPGATVTELRRHTGSSWSRIQYHVRLLEEAGLVRSVPHGRERRLFPPRTDDAAASSISLLRRGRVLALVQLVMENPGMIQRSITERMGLPRKTVRTYVDLLARDSLIVEVRDGRSRRYYPGPRAPALVERAEPDAADASGQEGH